MRTVFPGEREPLVVFAIKMPREWTEVINQTAKEQGTTKSRLARAALWDYFNKHEIAV